MAIIWRRLEHPKPWRPTLPGEELVGYYLGQTKRQGSYGEYTVALIGVIDAEGAVGTPRLVSGAALINALDGGMAQVGTLLRVVYGGVVEISGDRKMKAFEVFVGEGTLSADDLSQITLQ